MVDILNLGFRVQGYGGFYGLGFTSMVDFRV